ncbi:MAG: hypothetical protein LBQ27_01615 [Clostridiales bacterium]|jgi:hypothetical protein|nr:hypothetical protein [Clostridiales bacterium]
MLELLNNIWVVLTDFYLSLYQIGGEAVGIILSVLLIIAFLIPTEIAVVKKAPKILLIFLFNITVIGWIIALPLAFRKRK